MASTVKFYFTNRLSDQTYSTTPGNSQANYPLSNLSTYFPTSDSSGQWTTTSNDNSYLQVDIGTPYGATCIVLANYDVSSWTNVSVCAASNSIFTANVTSMLNVLTAPAAASNSTVTIWELPGTLARQYWRLVFTGSGGSPTDSFSASQFWVGTKLQFSSSYNFGYKTNNVEFSTSEMKALDGRIRTSQVYAGRKTWDVKFNAQNNSVRTGFLNFYSVVGGKLRPFYFQDVDGSLYYVHNADDYNPIDVSNYGLNNVSVKLKSQLSTF